MCVFHTNTTYNHAAENALVSNMWRCISNNRMDNTIYIQAYLGNAFVTRKTKAIFFLVSINSDTSKSFLIGVAESCWPDTVGEIAKKDLFGNGKGKNGHTINHQHVINEFILLLFLS